MNTTVYDILSDLTLTMYIAKWYPMHTIKGMWFFIGEDALPFREADRIISRVGLVYWPVI